MSPERLAKLLTNPEVIATPELSVSMALPDMNKKTLDEVLGGAGMSFQQWLLELIDESGMDDVAVYKKANIARKVFSRIRCKANYKSKKNRRCIRHRLTVGYANDAGSLIPGRIAFSPSNKFDLIITYFVTHRIYYIFEINAALFEYRQPILGEY